MIYEVSHKDKDVHEFASLAQKLYTGAFPKEVFDRTYFMSFWATVLEKKTGVVWLASPTDSKLDASAGIGAFLTNNPYSGLLQAHILFWLATEQGRGRIDNLRLYAQMEKWCKERNVKKIFAGSLFDKNSKKLKILYDRLGYKQHETIHLKTL